MILNEHDYGYKNLSVYVRKIDRQFFGMYFSEGKFKFFYNRNDYCYSLRQLQIKNFTAGSIAGDNKFFIYFKFKSYTK